MRTVHHSRMSFLGIAAVLVGTLVTPLAVSAEDQNYATISAPGPSEVEASRAIIAERALQSGDLGSMQEQALADVVAAAMAVDETTGADVVEAVGAAPLAQFRPLNGRSVIRWTSAVCKSRPSLNAWRTSAPLNCR